MTTRTRDTILLIIGLAVIAAPTGLLVFARLRPGRIVVLPFRPEWGLSEADGQNARAQIEATIVEMSPMCVLTWAEASQRLDDATKASLQKGATPQEAIEAGKRLGARWVIGGSARKHGDQVIAHTRSLNTTLEAPVRDWDSTRENERLASLLKQATDAAARNDWITASRAIHEAALMAPSSSAAQALQREALRRNPGLDYVIDLGNNVGLEMRWIPGGTFMMGSPPDEAGRSEDEGPQHEVTLEGFWISRTEVTQRQFMALREWNPSREAHRERPVDSVTFHHVEEFCASLSAIDGAHYKAPTEAQWEYACRAGSAGAFPWGADLESIWDYARYLRNSDGASGDVGLLKPNALGLHDMQGNVREWCRDGYAPDFYERAPRLNPQNGMSGALRVTRGGSFASFESRCRSAARGRFPPELGHYSLGIRVVREANDNSLEMGRL